jgi:hypothetical protein
MRIVTSFYRPPIGTNACDWSAVDDDTYSGGETQPIGFGATEAEAIADLMSQLEDADPSPRPAVLARPGGHGAAA